MKLNAVSLPLRTLIGWAEACDRKCVPTRDVELCVVAPVDERVVLVEQELCDDAVGPLRRTPEDQKRVRQRAGTRRHHLIWS